MKYKAIMNNGQVIYFKTEVDLDTVLNKEEYFGIVEKVYIKKWFQWKLILNFEEEVK